MYDIVRGYSAVKNGKASITARLGCQGRCVRGRGHLLGEVEEGSFKDIMIWKVYLTKQQQGFQCFSFWQSDLLKSKAKVREERKRWLSHTILTFQHCIFKFR